MSDVQRLATNIRPGDRLGDRRVSRVVPASDTGGWLRILFDDGTSLTVRDSERVVVWDPRV